MTFFRERWALCPGGQGVLRYLSHIGIQRVGFLHRFSLKTGMDFCLETKRVWFSRELRKCMNVLSIQSQMGKKEKEICQFVTRF